MPSNDQPFRQLHLDFHTSAQCQDVGIHFDPDEFVATLQMGRVNSINIFAKCHHGFAYYPTRVGTPHPNLKFDLLGQQIEALHRAGIRCPIYYTIKWDDLAGIKHPDWVVINKDGTAAMRPPLSGAWGWTTLDVASPYADFVAEQVEELLADYEVDGFWFDICFTAPNYSAWAQAQMRHAGVNLADDQAVWAYANQQDAAFFKRISDLVKGRAPRATNFYNGTVNSRVGQFTPFMTHLEVESLPTSGDAWGYLHFPIMGRQARTYGLETVGMTGRFHKSWADFGGLKTPDQLDYEVGTILAAGAKVCVGDQLHPNGRLDPAVYRLLAHSFGRIERLEPWLVNATPQAEAAILAMGSSSGANPMAGTYSPDVEGAAQIFLETGIQFDIIEPTSDFSRYPLLVLPDRASLDPPLLAKLEDYLARDGRLVLSGTAGLDSASGMFQLPGMPVTYQGRVATVPCYLRLDTGLAEDGLDADYDYVFYNQAHQVQPVAGAETLGELKLALFNRTWEHFTSHQHAPVGEGLGTPLAARKGGLLYFAAPLFSAYRQHDYWVYRAAVQAALRHFMQPPLIKPHGPGWTEFSLHSQPAGSGRPARRILHIVNYQARRTAQPIPHVDQAWPVYGMSVAVRADGLAPNRVYLAPEESPLEFSLSDGYITIPLPPVGPHTVVVIE